MLIPNATQATTTRASIQRASSAYSRPWLLPTARVTTAESTITTHSHIVAMPSLSLQSLTPHRRGTRYRQRPIWAARSQPKSMPLVWMGRMRP